MSDNHTVLLSKNMFGDTVCVDIYQRADGTFGFEEFRRDSEDGQGWFPIGHYSHQGYVSIEEAKQAALSSVGWLDDIKKRLSMDFPAEPFELVTEKQISERESGSGTALFCHFVDC